MGSLADAITANLPAKGPRCTVAGITAALDPADLADLEAALHNPAVPGSAIAAGLRAVGHHVGNETLQRHRRGQCGCAR